MGGRVSTSISSAPKQLSYLVLLLVVVLLVGIIGFSYSDGVTLSGAFYMTVDSFAFKHVGTNLISQTINTFLNVVGVIIVWFAIWTAFGLAVEGKFGEYFKEAKMKSQISAMRGHYIVCGAGRVGKHVGYRLKQRGEQVLFLEKDQSVTNKLLSEGFHVLDAGQVDEQTLLQAGIRHAKGIVTTLGDDSKNLLLVMTAKELVPGIKIASRVSDLKIINKFKRAGASIIIIPEAVGGVKLADALLGNYTHDVIVSD